MAISQCSMLIVVVRALQAQVHHLSIVRPLLGSVRQPGNDPLDLLALDRILDRSGYRFKISKKALSFVGHDTSAGKFSPHHKGKTGAINQKFINILSAEGRVSGIIGSERVHWAGAGA